MKITEVIPIQGVRKTMADNTTNTEQNNAAADCPNERIVTPRDGIFLVTRTSVWDDGKPCDEAYVVEIMNVDRRNCDDPKKIPMNRVTDGDWYLRGSNHRVENGCICRDIGWERKWAVNIDSVMDFVDKHGECVVRRNNDGFAEIEIYDNNREYWQGGLND